MTDQESHLKTESLKKNLLIAKHFFDNHQEHAAMGRINTLMFDTAHNNIIQALRRIDCQETEDFSK